LKTNALEVDRDDAKPDVRGRHVVEVKELLGHTKLETTMKYMHLAEDRKKGVTDCLTEGMGWLGVTTGNVVPIRGKI